jgi:hypothetical protein
MRWILDSGALLALERNDRAMWTRLKGALLAEEDLLTHGGVIGQAWRGQGARQARLSAALAAVDVRAIDEALGRAAGTLLARARRKDVIDAALVLLTENDDTLVTSDPGDLEPLAHAAGREILILRA